MFYRKACGYTRVPIPIFTKKDLRIKLYRIHFRELFIVRKVLMKIGLGASTFALILADKSAEALAKEDTCS